MRYKLDDGKTTDEWRGDIREIVGDKYEGVVVSRGDLEAVNVSDELTNSEKAAIINLVEDNRPLTPKDLVATDDQS